MEEPACVRKRKVGNQMRLLYILLAVAGSAVMSFGVFIGTVDALLTGVGMAFTSYLDPDMFTLVLEGVLGNLYFWIGASALSIALFGLSAHPASPDELPEPTGHVSDITE